MRERTGWRRARARLGMALGAALLLTACAGGGTGGGGGDDPAKGSDWGQMQWDQGHWAASGVPKAAAPGSDAGQGGRA
jgi:hypothetical protein